MEAASQNNRKRGRPCTLRDDKMLQGVNAYIRSNPITERGKIDIYFRIIALDQFLDDSRFDWLCSRDKLNKAKRGRHGWKPSILSELGRITNKEERENIALEICELKPKTKQAIRKIRQWRLGQEPKSNKSEMFMYFIKAVDEYISIHPSIDYDAIQQTLCEITDYLKSIQREE